MRWTEVRLTFEVHQLWGLNTVGQPLQPWPTQTPARSVEGETGMRAGALYPLFSHIPSVVLYTDHLKNLTLPKNGIFAVQFRYHHFEKKSLLLSFVADNLILFDICSRGMWLAQESLWDCVPHTTTSNKIYCHISLLCCKFRYCTNGTMR